MAFACLLALPAAAQAGTTTVGCTNGVGDAHGLVQAITDANRVADPVNTIQLGARCTYTLTTVDNYWYGPNGLPPIAANIVIVEPAGRGAWIERSTEPGTPHFRLFFVGADPANAGTGFTTPGKGTLRLQNVTLRGGLARGGNSAFGGGGAGMGGAIFNQGGLHLEGVTLTRNEAAGGSSGESAGTAGGGIGGAVVMGGNGEGFGSQTNDFGGAKGGAGGAGAGGGGAGFGTTQGGGAGGTPGGPNTGTGGSAVGHVGGNGSGAGAGAPGQGAGGGDFGFGGQGSVGGGGGLGIHGSGGGGGFGGGGGGGNQAPRAADPGFGGGQGSTSGGGGGGAGMGGAIFNHGGSVEALNVTLSGNSAQGGQARGDAHAGQGLGGAIFNLNGAVSLSSMTIADNTAARGGAGLYTLGYDAVHSGGASAELRDTVVEGTLTVARPVGVVTGPTNQAAGRLSFVTPSLLSAPVQRVEDPTVIGTPIVADPKLGGLNDNGGATATLVPQDGSPVVDRGSAGPVLDQRGVKRPQGSAPDVGAVEVATPAATTGAASNITPTAARLSGTASNPHVNAGQAYFEYRTGTDPPQQSEGIPVAAGAAASALEIDLRGLAANTTYQYRLVVENGDRTVRGEEKSFGTVAAATLPATDVGKTGATLNGHVDPKGVAAELHFEWGETTSYGHATPTHQLPAGAPAQDVAAPLVNLQPDTTYHYKLVLTTPGGTVEGTDRQFTTLADTPVAVTLPANPVGPTSATLNGSVDTKGADTKLIFEYGETTDYGTQTPEQTLAGATNPVPVKADIAALEPSTTYHYRAVAINDGGTNQGPDATFTTQAEPPPPPPLPPSPPPGPSPAPTPPAPAPSALPRLTLSTASVIVTGRSFRSTCEVQGGQASSCEVHAVSGSTVLARGQANGSTGALAVKLALTRAGRRALARAPGGMATTLRAAAHLTDGAALHAKTPARVFARSQRFSSRAGAFKPSRAKLGRAAKRFLRPLARNAKQVKGLRCVGYAGRGERRARRLARKRAKAACAYLRRQGLRARATTRARTTRKSGAKARRLQIDITHKP